AMLMSHGFNDWNVMPYHSTSIYAAARNKNLPVGLYMHQGGHGGPPPMDIFNAWMSHFLFGVENDWDQGGKAWIVRAGDSRNKPTQYADYPNPQSRNVVFGLGGDAPGIGSLRMISDADNGVANNAKQPAKTETFTDNRDVSGAEMAAAEKSDHRLLFTTGTLTQPLHLSGTPSIRLTLQSDQPAANLSVWLVSLPWNDAKDMKITDNLITRGWADPQNHRSQYETDELQPGKSYTLEFPLEPDDQIIPAGQQIGLMIFSSDSQFTVLPKPGNKLTVNIDSARLTLPIVGGKASVLDAIGTTEP
ncbi:MAG: CocE/NonD family hydrolase C-terminal non-catalytic domain-containing protein, partial [Planctomycetota bacterium]